VIDSFITLTAPAQVVTGTALGGLLILLIVDQLVDFQGSKLKKTIAFLRIFSIPLLALFILVVIVRIFAAIPG
jgi:hypothetical protein